MRKKKEEELGLRWAHGKEFFLLTKDYPRAQVARQTNRPPAKAVIHATLEGASRSVQKFSKKPGEVLPTQSQAQGVKWPPKSQMIPSMGSRLCWRTWALSLTL